MIITFHQKQLNQVQLKRILNQRTANEMKLILQVIGAVLLTCASLDPKGSIQRKHHSKDNTIIMDNKSQCYTQYLECMSKKPPFTNTKSTTTTTTNPHKDKKIKNTKK